jgi:hypothetical protein
MFCIFIKTKTSIVTESLNSLQDAINTSPIEKNEIKKMVSQHLKKAIIHQQVSKENNITNNENSIRNSMINKSKNKLTIADSSPFTKHFKDIEKHVLNEINNDYLNSTSVEEENEYYCPEYIASLLKRYMPYCFVWSGFVLRNLNNENTRTRFTNVTVENHFYSNKGMGQFFKRLLPAQYASK